MIISCTATRGGGEMVDAGDLKSPGWRVREGSIPSRPTQAGSASRASPQEVVSTTGTLFLCVFGIVPVTDKKPSTTGTHQSPLKACFTVACIASRVFYR